MQEVVTTRRRAEGLTLKMIFTGLKSNDASEICLLLYSGQPAYTESWGTGPLQRAVFREKIRMAKLYGKEISLHSKMVIYEGQRCWELTPGLTNLRLHGKLIGRIASPMQNVQIAETHEPTKKESSE